MGKESFEDKIRQQLESYEAPYEKPYWKKYARTYPAPRLSWWKLWWMPYLFSSLLFGGAWFWFGRDAQRLPDAASLRDTVVVKELVVTRDTLVVRDTVVLVWRAENSQQRSTRGSQKIEEGAIANNGLRQRTESSLQAKAGGGTVVGQRQNTDVRKPAAGGGRKSNEQAPQETESGDESEKAKDNEHLTITASDSLKEQAKVDPAVLAAQMDSIEQAAIAEIPTEPESKMQNAGIFVSAGPRLTSFSPLNYGNFDTRFGTFVGGAVQIDWQKWQLELGIQFGAQKNEIDDVSLVPFSQLQQFPGYNRLTNGPDEIGVLSTHLLLPIQLRFTFFDYRAWRVQVAGGALGNAVLSETFEYYFDQTDQEIFERSRTNRGGLNISHLNAGIGTSYQWRQNLELQAILNYYHPLRPLGLNRLEAGALSLQLGLNWLLLPR